MSNPYETGVRILPVNEPPPQNDITADSGDGMYANAPGHSCMTMVHCEWVSEGASQICGVWISCESVPAHFRDAHGIRQIKEWERISCRWTGHCKNIRRHNFVRHIRESHLGHHRE